MKNILANHIYLVISMFNISFFYFYQVNRTPLSNKDNNNNTNSSNSNSSSNGFRQRALTNPSSPRTPLKKKTSTTTTPTSAGNKSSPLSTSNKNVINKKNEMNGNTDDNVNNDDGKPKLILAP